MADALQDALARRADERAARIAAIIARFEAGDPLAEIGEAFGVTGERIRQIVKRAGCVPRRERPSPIVVAARAAQAANRMRKMNADPVFAAAHYARAAERMRMMRADPEFMRKQRLSRAGFNVPDHLLADYRLARRKGYSKEDALRIAQESHRAAHSLPCSAASSAAPPADAPPCSAGLTAGASKDAPAISGGAG